MDYTTVGKRLRLIRGKEKQVDFAAKFELSQIDVSRFERGEVKPAHDFLYRLCIKTNVDLGWVLSGRGWTCDTGSAAIAEDWIRRALNAHEQQISKIIIVTYLGEVYSNAGDREVKNGFILVTDLGLLSITGDAFKTTSTSGTAAYVDVLKMTLKAGIPVFKNTLQYNEAQDMEKMDVSCLIEDQGLPIDIYNEMRSLKPNLYPAREENISAKDRKEVDLEIQELLRLVTPEMKQEFIKMLKAHRDYLEGLDKLRKRR